MSVLSRLLGVALTSCVCGRLVDKIDPFSFTFSLFLLPIHSMSCPLHPLPLSLTRPILSLSSASHSSHTLPFLSLTVPLRRTRGHTQSVCELHRPQRGEHCYFSECHREDAGPRTYLLGSFPPIHFVSAPSFVLSIFVFL
jgi:hypothetical protein